MLFPFGDFFFFYNFTTYLTIKTVYCIVHSSCLEGGWIENSFYFKKNSSVKMTQYNQWCGFFCSLFFIAYIHVMPFIHSKLFKEDEKKKKVVLVFFCGMMIQKQEATMKKNSKEYKSICTYHIICVNST